MFEKASRLKLRIGTPSGVITAEDLWDLPLTSKTGQTNLDDIARNLSRQVSAAEESFVDKPATKDPTLTLGFEIVKRVIEVRLEERDAAKAAKAKADRKTRILEIMAAKQDDSLKEASMEELEAMLKDL